MHEIIEQIKKSWNKFWYGSEIKKVRVTVRELEQNSMKIQEAIVTTQNEIAKLQRDINETNTADDEGKKRKKELQEDLKTAHDMLGILQGELQKQEEIIKKHRESRHVIAPKDALSIGGMIIVGIFVIGLERENPRFIKLSEFILKLFPMH